MTIERTAIQSLHKVVSGIGGAGVIAAVLIIVVSPGSQHQAVTALTDGHADTNFVEYSNDTLEPQMSAADTSEKEIDQELGLPNDPAADESTESQTKQDIRQTQIEQALEEELLRIDAKEGTTFRKVMDDERVQEYVKGALQVSSDFVAAENRPDSDLDKLTLTVTGKEILQGSWETSYTSILTGMFVLDIETENGTIVSIEKKPLDDIRAIFSYTDEEKEFIGMALDDPVVQASLKEKEDAGIATAIAMRGGISNYAINCPPEHCVLITIREVNAHATLAIMLNTEEHSVVQLKEFNGW
ncbi:MAG TPA: hypothetical protein VJP79_10850 [Nitrososphaera sp.]|nr:hypothetical protein [Nitrososphaera sp.]